MFKLPGFSVYLSSFDTQKPILEQCRNTGSLIFLSLHISEEFCPDYCRRAEEICHWMYLAGFRTIADVSRKTLDQFGESDMTHLAMRLNLWALRIDYGFSVQEISELASQMPVVLNASTINEEDAKQIAAAGSMVMAMHNFYPRPETGLDSDFLLHSTQTLQQAGLKVLGFFPGDSILRGPLYLGLPMLESHRGLPPSCAFADLAIHYGLDGLFVSDPGLSTRELSRIRRFCEEGILEIPTELDAAYTDLYDQIYTNRPDSPNRLVRFAESRVYACFGKEIAPANCAPRVRGSITLDNSRYSRYSGEIQLMRSDLPADERVNVIGHIKPPYLLLADCIQNGAAFQLTRD